MRYRRTPHKIFDILSSLASRNDEQARVTAIRIAFSRSLRARLQAQSERRDSDRQLTALGSIVDRAVLVSASCNEVRSKFIECFEREAMLVAQRFNVKRFTVQHFPISRQIFGPVLAGSIDSRLEVAPSQAATSRIKRSKTKRILLVLPPIDLDATADMDAASTNTPPLGLGILASHLSSLGHDAQILDCHRNPSMWRKIPQYAESFDVVGFNVVLTTLRSVTRLLHLTRSSSKHPLLVVGGPAVNLGCWTNLILAKEYRDQWDFAISSNAPQNLEQVIDSIDCASPWPNSASLQANPHSKRLQIRGITISELEQNTSSVDSKKFVWAPPAIDRRVFTGPNGYYEPNRSRSHKNAVFEAHIVMSQGCDWNCAFCTERRQLSGGERRRAVEDVLREVDSLSDAYLPIRIQFVDDNVLPQLSLLQESHARSFAIEWANKFVAGLFLLRVDKGHRITWRGIFRIEDFLEYERAWPAGSFIDQLVESGCQMLAFGVEHGDEIGRRKQKGGSGVKNTDIQLLFSRLRAAGIHTKAYFILGGPNETKSSAYATIDFAINCGVTLAYFAIYKAFVQATVTLRRTDETTGYKSTRYLHYSQYLTSWDDELANPDISSVHKDDFRPPEREPHSRNSYSNIKEARSAYKALASLGFSFRDLVKYTDYHADDGPSGDLLKRVALGSPQEYFSALRDAYFGFYLRPAFITDFRSLLEAGY